MKNIFYFGCIWLNIACKFKCSILKSKLVLSECNDLYLIAIAFIAFMKHEVKQCPVFWGTPGMTVKKLIKMMFLLRLIVLIVSSKIFYLNTPCQLSLLSTRKGNSEIPKYYTNQNPYLGLVVLQNQSKNTSDITSSCPSTNRL